MSSLLLAPLCKSVGLGGAAQLGTLRLRMVGSCWGQWRAVGGGVFSLQPRNGDVSRESVPGAEGAEDGWPVLVPVLPSPVPLGAGLAARPLGSALRSGQVRASRPQRGPDPRGHHSPSMLCTFFLNYFYYYDYSPHTPRSDGVGAETGRRVLELCPLRKGLALALQQGSDVPEVSTFPGTPCRDPTWTPLWQEGGLPNPLVSGPRMDVPGRGTARCRFPPFCRAGAVRPPPSRGRAVPHAFCDRCAGRGTEGQRRAGRGLSAVVGGVGKPPRVWTPALELKHPPRAAWHLGVHPGMQGEGAAGAPRPHPTCPHALDQALCLLPAMLGWKMLFAPFPSVQRSACPVDAPCAALPARAWHALVKAGWGHGYLMLGEAIPRGFGCWHEAGRIAGLPGAGASLPCCRLSFARRDVYGLVLDQRAQRWMSVPGSEFTPEMVLSGQHKAAVKAAPLGSGWMPAIRMGPPGQGGVPAIQECMWPAMH